LYAHVPYPDHETELTILVTRYPDITDRLCAQIVGFVQALRKQELEKKPGIAEMLDFAAALMGLGVADLTDDPAILQATLTTLLKTHADQSAIPTEVAQRLAGKAA
jgi:MoxR-like ATPase